MDFLRKCGKCGDYSLGAKCACGGGTENPHPPKYSVGDKYAPYRRKAKYG